MSPAADKKSVKIWDITTPIFTPEMGVRLKNARMKMLWTQAAMGDALGCSQQQVADIEQGRLATLRRPFTTAMLKSVLRHHADYVLFSSGSQAYDPAAIRAKFWEAKDAAKGNRTTHGHQLRANRNG